MSRPQIVTASAGTGKTYHLTHELARMLAEGSVRPEGIIATTFTRKAAAELASRARQLLLEQGRQEEAFRLAGGLVGTVHSVCGQLLARFALEAGISPEIRVLDEQQAAGAFNEAITDALANVDAARMSELSELFGAGSKFGPDRDTDWRDDVRRIIDDARANCIDAAGLQLCKQRSIAEFIQHLPPQANGAALDAALTAAIDAFLNAVAANGDETKGTQGFCRDCEKAKTAIATKGVIPWHEWVKLAKAAGVTKASKAAVAPLQQAASQHLAHPRLRAEWQEWVTTLFDAAAAALAGYQEWKGARGLIDFTDQEALVLRLLDNAAVSEQLRDELDLLIVDEFQDTSPIQLALFLRLAQLAKHALWVGDPKQSIFAFRGTDPSLMASAAAKLGTSAVLNDNYRMRPALADLVSTLFAQAFGTAVPVATKAKRAELASVPLRWWKLSGKNLVDEAEAQANGIAMLLGHDDSAPELIEDPHTHALRAASPGDIAVLCRDNKDCAAVAAALERRGIRAALAREGLLGTPESALVLAALRLLAEPDDTLAIAEIVALTAAEAQSETWLQDRLQYLTGDGSSREWQADHPVIAAIARLRASTGQLVPSEALDELLTNCDLRRYVLRWGRTALRLGNIEALRRQVQLYEDSCHQKRAAASLTGLIGWLQEARGKGQDAQAEGKGDEAVNVLTYHKAKGLEWPIVILTGLRKDAKPRLWGLSVQTDSPDIDLDQPLAGRWLRYWLWPYGEQKKDTGLEQLAGIQQAEAAALQMSTEEDIRLLYVGMTRARDVLVIASRGKEDWLELLYQNNGNQRLEVPEGEGQLPVTFTQANDAVPAIVSAIAAEAQVAQAAQPVLWYAPAPGVREYLPARVAASSFKLPEGVTAKVERVIEIGERLPLTGAFDERLLGEAIHAYFAVDDLSLTMPERITQAAQSLRNFGVAANLQSEALVRRADELRTFIQREYGEILTWQTEYPLQLVFDGQSVIGWADLVIETPKGHVIVDHKPLFFPKGENPEIPVTYYGQLLAYRKAVRLKTGVKVKTIIHNGRFSLSVNFAP